MLVVCLSVCMSEMLAITPQGSQKVRNGDCILQIAKQTKKYFFLHWYYFYLNIVGVVDWSKTKIKL